MGTVVVLLILAAIIAFAVFGTIKRIRHGSSCCGERDPAPKKIKVSDKDKSHYPYAYELGIDGMHCSNCARRVENGFNKIPGIWAKTDVSKKQVILMTKEQVEQNECFKIVSDSGYTLISFKKVR